MKKALLLAGGIILASVLLFCVLHYQQTANYLFRNRNPEAKRPPVVDVSLRPVLDRRATKLLGYARRHGYDTAVVLMADMRLPSGSNRFFVYDLQKKRVIQQSLVAHGRCNETVQISRRYGNEVGCGCTSLGRYMIGAPYQGKFGLAYKLYGLDSTNNNAFERFVVLHAHECVPSGEVAPYPICQSDGCPTLAPSFLKKLAVVIDKATRPVLLEIFDE